MGDANRVPPHGPSPEPNPVVALAETQLQQLRSQLDELAATVAQLEPPDRRSAVEAVIAAIDHNLDEIARRLHARGGPNDEAPAASHRGPSATTPRSG